ncbi:MAG: hypothetical protein HY290_07115, partial [Planctomycetia bacterium]|nr:hypothetical protein [Planctomycetia bacterium]
MSVNSSFPQLTRREFAAGALTSLVGGAATLTLPRFAEAQLGGAPSTAVLVNEAVLRKQYPQEAAALMQAARQFATRN